MLYLFLDILMTKKRHQKLSVINLPQYTVICSHQENIRNTDLALIGYTNGERLWWCTAKMAVKKGQKSADNRSCGWLTVAVF